MKSLSLPTPPTIVAVARPDIDPGSTVPVSAITIVAGARSKRVSLSIATLEAPVLFGQQPFNQVWMDYAATSIR